MVTAGAVVAGVTANSAGSYVLQQRWDVPDDRCDDFRHWYDHQHLGEMADLPGVLLGRRFERDTGFPFRSPTTFDHLALYDVDDAAAFDTPEYRALSGHPRPHTPEYRALSGHPRPHTPETTPGLDWTQTLYRQLFPEAGALSISGGLDGSTTTLERGPGILHIMMSCHPACQDDFNGWYNEEHLPALAAVEGVLSARRLIADEGAPRLPDHLGPARYLALYELADLGVVTSDAFLAAGAPTPRRLQLGDQVAAHVQVFRQVSTSAW